MVSVTLLVQADRKRRYLAAAIFMVGIVAPSAIARSQTLQGEIAAFDRPQVDRPDYPVPDDPQMLFYIQRSNNANTVVYAARRNAQGEFDSRNPVDVYWRRLASDGKRSELTYLERTIAFGVEVHPLGSGDKAFEINLVSYPRRKVVLKLDADGSPVVLMDIPGHKLKLEYAYIQLADSRLVPRLDYIDIFGKDIASGQYVRERIEVASPARPRVDRK